MSSTAEQSPAPRRERRRRVLAAERLAAEQDGVLGRRQLYALGVTRWQVRAQVQAGRWRRTGRQTVSVTTGALGATARRWVAVLETGPRAALDGVTALQHAGLRTVEESTLHVIAPKSSAPLRSPGVRVHESRRFRDEDVLQNGVRRVRTPVATVHAALWAVSDRQAVLFVVAAVQQRVVRAADVVEALEAVRRHPRRRLLARVLRDITDGAQSLQELDVMRQIRRRGMPEPVRQLVVELRTGRAYLDIDWQPWGVSLELDGTQHDAPEARLADVLRDLDVAVTGRMTLRLPLWAWRLDADAVLERLDVLLRSRGWRPPASSAAAA